MNYKMRSMPNAHCYVAVDGSRIQLWSYNTMIIEIINDYPAVHFACTGVYSPTTARHINRFCAELNNLVDYQFCKALSKSERQCVDILVTASYNPVRDLIEWYRNNGTTLNQAAYDKAVNETKYKEMRCLD